MRAPIHPPCAVTQLAFVMPRYDLTDTKDFPCEIGRGHAWDVWCWSIEEQTWEFYDSFDVYERARWQARCLHRELCRREGITPYV